MKNNWIYLITLACTTLLLIILSPIHGLLTLFIVALGVLTFSKMTLALKESEERWKFALEGAGDGVWDWDIPTDQVIYSKQYKEIHGFTDEDIAQKTQAWQQRIHPDDRAHVKSDITDCLDGKTINYINEHRIICKDGSIKWVLARGMVVKRDENKNPIRMIGTHADITERKNMEERINLLASYDTLTHIPNRSLFNDRLQQAIALAHRDQSKMAVMFIDLDGFKPVNDQHGHNVGDLLLKEVATRLIAAIRASDTVARLGGDEFVVLLPNIEQNEDAIIVANKIKNALDTPFVIPPHSLNISASIGIAIYPDHAQDEKLLLINADVAMYHVKQTGKSNFALYNTHMLT